MNQSRDQAAQHTRTYLVEHYWPGLTVGQLKAATRRLRAQAEAMARTGLDVRYVRSTLMLQDEAAFCFFEAASAELVEQAYKGANLAYERLSPAVSIEDAPTPVERKRREMS